MYGTGPTTALHHDDKEIMNMASKRSGFGLCPKDHWLWRWPRCLQSV